MAASPSKFRRWLLALGALFAAGLATLWLTRVPLTASVIAATLTRAGATEVKFDVTDASPWRLRMENVNMNYRARPFSAREISFERTSWWSPSLGRVSVKQARLPVAIDGSDTNPWAWTSYGTGGGGGAVPAVPVDEISIDGQLVIQAAALPDQTLTIALEAKAAGAGQWKGEIKASGPGLGFSGQLGYATASKEVEFKLRDVALDLAQWRGFVQRIVVLPGGTWELAGKFTGSAEGKVAGKELIATAQVSMRDGFAKHAGSGVVIEGIEADLEFTDLDHFRSKPGVVRAAKLVSGGLTLTEIAAGIEFTGWERVSVLSATFNTLGGKVAAEPFKLLLSQRELAATLLIDGIDVEAVQALTQDLPGRATGRVDGRLPIRVDDGGLRLGMGYLELKKGVQAELQLNAQGMLTRGLDPKSPTFQVMQKIEAGLLRLKLGELRLEVRPPNAPAGRTATLRLAGEPVDPQVKAPVKLDLNVNGPIEALLNIGLNSRARSGVK
jgi:hypothetical protein